MNFGMMTMGMPIMPVMPVMAMRQGILGGMSDNSRAIMNSQSIWQNMLNQDFSRMNNVQFANMAAMDKTNLLNQARAQSSLLQLRAMNQGLLA